MAVESPWSDIAQRKQDERAAKLPREWRLPSHHLPKDPPKPEHGAQNVLDVPPKYMQREEIEITESYTTPKLLAAVASRKLSAVEVTKAFCHRAALAQQLTNCLTEILFESAIKRAEELDKYLRDNGKAFGPLHGLPVSVKDTFNIAGVDTSIGIASLCFKPATSNAPLVDLLLSLGCVVVAKTNVPQTLAALDSANNIFGRTMNPISRLCTAGGSSGGEGVLIAMKGSMMGIGTDIGGSIRIPAMCNGLYGFKPSTGRLPYGGQAHIGPEGIGRASVQAVAGPITRSVEDLEVFMRAAMPAAAFYGEDCLHFSGSWPSIPTNVQPSGRPLTIGILRSDGNCALLPPVSNVLSEVSGLLKQGALNIRVVELPTPKAWTRAQSAMSKLMYVEGNQTMAALLEGTSEPLVPWMQTRFRTASRATLEHLAKLQAQRASLEQEMMKVWYATDSGGRRTRDIDAIICPVAPHPVPEIDRWNAVGYTSSWVLFDYPAATIPVRNVVEGDLELGRPLFSQGQESALGSWDAKNRELWDEKTVDRKVYLGTPLSVQLVVPRLEEERLVAVMKLVDTAVKADGNPRKSRL